MASLPHRCLVAPQPRLLGLPGRPPPAGIRRVDPQGGQSLLGPADCRAWTTRSTSRRRSALLGELYSPGIVGYLNDYKLVVVKVNGEFVWHKHDDTDDFFLVVHGRLTIQLRDRDVVLNAGELFVVPRGVEHCPKADEEAHVLLIEPRGTVNTGDAGGELTAQEREI